MNKEKTFEWNDELVAEYSHRLPSYFNQGHSSESALKEFKKEKLKEEVNITIADWFNDGKEIPDGSLEGISFELKNFSAPIYITKERLASILLAESKGELFMDNEEDRKQRKLISYKEFLQFGEDCFNSARHTEKKIGEFSIYEEYKYKSFSDFMNSQKPKRTLKQIIGSYINSK